MKSYLAIGFLAVLLTVVVMVQLFRPYPDESLCADYHQYPPTICRDSGDCHASTFEEIDKLAVRGCP